jgi:hypothetical protein
MIIRMVAGAALLVGVAAMADEAADRAKLAGEWQIEEAGAKDVPSRWMLEEKGESYRISAATAGQPEFAYECNTLGRDCEIKDNGKSAKVSLYFNGPNLVEFVTRGSDVVKRRFSAKDDELVVEVTPVVPPGKSEIIRYKRVQTAASHSPAATTETSAATQNK